MGCIMSGKARKILGVSLLILLFTSLIIFVAWGFSHIWEWGIAILLSLGVFAASGVFGTLVGLAVLLITKD